MATCAINTALRRHAGHYADTADPVMGIMAGTAIGRDLRRVERVLCVGGIFVHSDKQAAEEMVLRCFEDPDITHVEGSVDPIRDIEIINLELIMADLQTVENRLAKVERKAQTNKDKDAMAEVAVLKKIKDALEAEKAG